MDRLTKEQRHRNMAAIRSRDTKPELIVRRWLWSRGFRYRLNYKRLPPIQTAAWLPKTITDEILHKFSDTFYIYNVKSVS